MKAIVQQAKIDVPPLVRREVWAVLLNVDETSARALWAAFDHELPGAADHQIDLDIPRCHQVNYYLCREKHTTENHSSTVSSVTIVASRSCSVAKNIAMLGGHQRERTRLLASMLCQVTFFCLHSAYVLLILKRVLIQCWLRL